MHLEEKYIGIKDDRFEDFVNLSEDIEAILGEFKRIKNNKYYRQKIMNKIEMVLLNKINTNFEKMQDLLNENLDLIKKL